MRPIENPAPADALAITKALRTHGGTNGRRDRAAYDVPGPHRRIRNMIEEAQVFISQIPSNAVGFIFLEAGTPVQPDLQALGKYQCHAGALGGVWSSSPEIAGAMLERYKSRATTD